MEIYKVARCPSTELSYTNKAIINPLDALAQFEHIAVRYPKNNEAFVFSVKPDKSVSRGRIAFNNPGRKWASLMIDANIEAAPYKFELDSQCLSSITFLTDFSSKQNVSQEFDTEEMAKQFSQQFLSQAFTVGQIFAFVFQSNNSKVIFELRVKNMIALNLDSKIEPNSVEIGLTMPNTVNQFEAAENSEIRLYGKCAANADAPTIFTGNFEPTNLGIGGLGDQFNRIFVQAFASRLIPPEHVLNKRGDHVKGILLYGPPGTGKTLIARQIGKMLMAREPKVVNGPEVLNKFVGESEANIRRLFQDAEEEQKKNGLRSGLHTIIFDEIDAICKARGSSPGSAGVGDNVVNQLLSKIDGVDALNNVLIIGMTNRRDLIDEALLRPGRLELQIEIGLPNKAGRLEILNIHTKEFQEYGVLDADVSLEEIAESTKNYTGAELAGLIRAAKNRALKRVIKEEESKVEIDKKALDDIKLTRADFQYAMKYEVKPALGASEDQLKKMAKPIIQYDAEIGDIQSSLTDIIKAMLQPDTVMEEPYMVLLLGEPSCGLTTLAANVASKTNFPFIRVYQPGSTEDKSESSKIQYMKKLFDDASKSELSCVVIDNLEVILEYHRIGPRFSNSLRIAFKNKRDLYLPDRHKMLVICTCNSKTFLEQLDLKKVFQNIFQVPSLTQLEQVSAVFSHHAEQGDLPFTETQCNELYNKLRCISFNMGIKSLEHLIRYASKKTPDERVKVFLNEMYNSDLIEEGF